MSLETKAKDKKEKVYYVDHQGFVYDCNIYATDCCYSCDERKCQINEMSEFISELKESYRGR